MYILTIAKLKFASDGSDGKFNSIIYLPYTTLHHQVINFIKKYALVFVAKQQQKTDSIYIRKSIINM